MGARQANGPALRVLLAFDSFKGSVTAPEACRASAAALAARFGERVATIEIPLADGGEGSLGLLKERLALTAVSVGTVDAIGRERDAEYLFDEAQHIAYIEVARAVGLPEVSDVALQPGAASSYGAGLLAADALRRGATRLVVFLGGSATTDGGAGLFAAIGGRLLDGTGQALRRGGAALADLAEVDTASVLPGALTADWVFVADVNAPLLGPTGAAQNYAPQKGAVPEDVALLEGALERAADVLERSTGRALRDRVGAGAAGGMPLFVSAFCRAEMLAGGPFIAAEMGALAALDEVDLVFTGEGRFDAQSLDGKVVGTLMAAAQQRAQPPAIVVVAGDVREAAQMRRSGALEHVAGVFGIAESAAELPELQHRAAELVSQRVAEVVSVALALREGNRA